MSKDYYDESSSASSAPSLSAAMLGEPVYWTTYPLELPLEYNQAIGEICSRWSWLEFQCGVIAREVLRLDKAAGFALTGGMSMRSVSTVLIALSLGKFLDNYPNLKGGLNSLGEKLYNIGDMRNEYAHGIWGYENQQNPNLGLWKFKRPEDRVSAKWINKPLAALQADAKKLKELQHKAQDLTWDLKDALRGTRVLRQKRDPASS
jgi:hypothetical protein